MNELLKKGIKVYLKGKIKRNGEKKTMKQFLIFMMFITAIVLENHKNMELIEPSQFVIYWGYMLLVISIFTIYLEIKKEM